MPTVLWLLVMTVGTLSQGPLTMMVVGRYASQVNCDNAVNNPPPLVAEIGHRYEPTDVHLWCIQSDYLGHPPTPP